jgi:hypothetical protein
MVEWMEAHLTGLVLYDSRLFNRTSNVGRWAASVARNFEFAAIRHAPVNKRPNTSSGRPPGFLKSGLHVSDERIGPKHIQVVLRSLAPYTAAVAGGTVGPITATTHPYMILPRNPGPGRRKRRHYTVSGQRPNNFLAKAAADTARRHPSLRGLDSLLYQQF